MRKQLTHIVIILTILEFFCLKIEGKSIPNIVLILADDMGWGDIAANGNPIIQTPVLDKLASESLSFDRFYVCPLCAPTRAELFTGRYFLRTGVSGVTGGFENMNPNETTLAEIMKQNGFNTGCFGKWHNGQYYLQHPNQQGFDRFVGFMVGHLGYYFNTIYDFNGTDVKSDGYCTDFFTRKAIEFIKKNDPGKTGKPFFCYIPYNVPHSPFQVPEKYFKKYNSMGNDSLLSSVYGMVENMDQNIGLILKKLEELKLRENTIVIFLSDNGPNTDRYNGNMKGRKGSVDEGGIRVPFYISWPYKIKPGVSPQIAQGIDLLPTLVSVCSLKYEAAVPWDGIDLSNQVLHGANPFDRYIFSRQAAWPLSKCNGSVRDMQYRLVVSGKDTLLYDMISDPAQKKNISGEKPEIRKKLAVAFLNWQNEMVSNYKLQTTIKAGFNEEKFIFLPVQDAQLSGKVKYSSIHPNQSYTENWVQSGDSIIWNLNMHQSGTYRVNVQYGCKKTETGSRFLLATKQGKTEFTIFKPFESIILPNRDYVTRKESVERTWGWMSAGMISLGAGNEQIKLKLIKNSGNEAGLIKALRLIRSNN